VTLMALSVAIVSTTACERSEEHGPKASKLKENAPAVKKLEELTLACGNDASLKLVLIPAGEFVMGADETPEQVVRKIDNHVPDLFQVNPDFFKREQPQHRVRITKPFYMGVYAVTQAQYEAVMGVNPSHFKGVNNPVEMVSWNDAVEFCKKLSAKTGQTVRLPTEAEWEYACRAGTTTPFNTGETISTDQANYIGNFTYGSGRKGENRKKTVAVGSFAANGFGLYDMHGNVLEWCQDWYDEGYYKKSPTEDPLGPEKGQGRVLRGGSWAVGPWYCRSALRRGSAPAGGLGDIGFRVVCAPRP
jgi:formylglycine-generating enzyme required for sulfatase activity